MQSEYYRLFNPTVYIQLPINPILSSDLILIDCSVYGTVYVLMVSCSPEPGDWIQGS